MSDLPMTQLNEMLAGLVSPGQIEIRRQRPIRLSFAEVDERFIWICDQDVRIGLIDRKEATIEWLAPHPGRPSPAAAEIPPMYHAPTYQGGRIIAQWWLIDMMGFDVLPGAPYRVPLDGPPPRHSQLERDIRKAKPRMSWRFDTDSGTSISFTIAQSFDAEDAIQGEHRVTIGYDPLADSYVADISATLDAPNHYLLECANFYAGGVYDNRPRTKRHHSTIWAHPDGRFVRWPHNPVSYMTPGMNAPRGERAIAEGGFIGYFADPHTNPVIEIVESDCHIAGATCCNIYDEHLVCLPEEGYTGQPRRWNVRMRLLSLLPEVAAQVVRQAETIQYGVDPSHLNPIATERDCSSHDLSRRLNYNPRFPAFYYGQVNDFEEPVPVDQPVVGCCIFASEHPDAAVYWDAQQGRSGQRSIRLTGEDNDATVRTSGHGPTPHLSGDTTYRLSGWIRCQGATGQGARLRFDEIGVRPREQKVNHIAGPVRNTCEWTYVEAVFCTPPTAQFGWLYLELTGPGLAWFDDVALEEVSASC